ncbi:hypothetical protein P43SY_003258 [Pythium insidiosum]|uniref:Uncharacterized protein n=1 Tax=Pythium insidiosum TaxID=114742 RepID=A0AAD5Q3I9_PYTIN|nr:hypothetical protein P43SY_003258 [Pythium insidiosum]
MAPSPPKPSRQRCILNLKPGDPILLVNKPRDRRRHLYDTIERTHIIDLVDLIPLHADSQRNILDEKITHVLKSKAANEKLREEEEAEAKKKPDERDYLSRSSRASICC